MSQSMTGKSCPPRDERPVLLFVFPLLYLRVSSRTTSRPIAKPLGLFHIIQGLVATCAAAALTPRGRWRSGRGSARVVKQSAHRRGNRRPRVSWLELVAVSDCRIAGVSEQTDPKELSFEISEHSMYILPDSHGLHQRLKFDPLQTGSCRRPLI